MRVYIDANALLLHGCYVGYGVVHTYIYTNALLSYGYYILCDSLRVINYQSTAIVWVLRMLWWVARVETNSYSAGFVVMVPNVKFRKDILRQG